MLVSPYQYRNLSYKIDDYYDRVCKKNYLFIPISIYYSQYLGMFWK